MKFYLLPFSILIFYNSANATIKDSTVYYHLHDSVNAVQFLAEISITEINNKQKAVAGIKTDAVKLSLKSEKKNREIVFEFPVSASVVATGLKVDADEKGEISFGYNWTIHETYKLLVALATDSAENFSLYSGYAWLPNENKWKLIGTCKIAGRWNTLQDPASFVSGPNSGALSLRIGQVWCQGNNGNWTNLKEEKFPTPVINLFSHQDSLAQHQKDLQLIRKAIVKGNTDARESAEDLYYKIEKEGTGRQVTAKDTVTVFYKLTLLNDSTIVNQTSDKPATFPLNRLIKGWQIGLSLCKVGGRIKLIIPSNLAYSIRTRSAKIPPNSILVFDIEVVDAKSPL